MAFQAEETERMKPPNVKEHDGPREEGSHELCILFPILHLLNIWCHCTSWLP